MALKVYSNKTLQDNWNEDRLQASCSYDETKKICGGTGSKTIISKAEEGFPEVSKRVSDYDEAFINAPHYTRYGQPDTMERILPESSTRKAGLVESTNSFFQKPVLEPRPAAKPKTRPMLNKANIHEVHQPRDVNAPLEGYGATLPTHRKEANQSERWVTTNQHMYKELPAKAKLQPPAPDKYDDERFVGGLPASCNPNFPERGRVPPNDRTFFRAKPFHGEEGFAHKSLSSTGFLKNDSNSAR